MQKLGLFFVCLTKKMSDATKCIKEKMEKAKMRLSRENITFIRGYYE
jgi:hypothetical protein